MTTDIIILVAALAIAAGFTFLGRALSRSWLLVPLDTKNPVPTRPVPPRFHLRMLGQVMDHTTIRPRILLVLVLFTLLALMGKLFLNPLPDWSLIVMAIAFTGAGLSELFDRRGLSVLSEPLARTALLLPLLPALGFWLPIHGGEMPLFGGAHPVLWLMVGLFYGFMAVSRRSRT